LLEMFPEVAFSNDLEFKNRLKIFDQELFIIILFQVY
jgi:hypothetical protein